MNFETWLIFGLCAVNVFQLFFWSWTTHKLLDKLMSRNYGEYVQVRAPKHELPRAQEPEVEDFQDEDLHTLNQTMAGLI